MTGTDLRWEELVGLEPALGLIEAEVRFLASRAHEDPHWCANARWYGYPDPAVGFKRKVSHLVGMSRGAALSVTKPACGEGCPKGRHLHLTTAADILRDPAVQARRRAVAELIRTNATERILRSSDAYDIAYDHLYDLLPGCRDCGCARMGDLW